MTQTGRILRLATGLTIAATLSGTLAACGGDSDADQSKAAAGATCTPADGKQLSAKPPSDVPLPTGASKPFDILTEGATKYYKYEIAGGPSNLSPLRDSYDTTLTSDGYKITDTDEEPGAEAESSFSGPHDGSTKFDNLCSGEIVFQLELTS